MNEYKITYSGESEGYRIITDRTEAAAKKFFREEAKRMDLGRITIDDVELVSDNAMATKRNERETLEVIRQMVADLGSPSYLATAFEGCFEDAENNIDDDAAYSMKDRYESSERKLAEAMETIERLKSDIQLLSSALENERATTEAVRNEMAVRTLNPDDLEDVRQLLNDRATEADEAAVKAADEIVKYADQPESKEFRQAVTDHRNYTKEAEYTRSILERVVAAEAATHATTTAADVAA